MIEQLDGVLCCGNVVFDIAAYPAEDWDWNTTRWVDTIAENIGGNGANTSYALAKLGVPVRLLSLLGADERGNRLQQILADTGVDTSRVERAPHGVPTPSTVILVRRGGDRKFLHRPGASREMRYEQLRISREGPYSHFHFANPFALPNVRGQFGAVMQTAKSAGLTTSVDTGWDSLERWMEDLGPGLPFTDLLFVNEGETEMLGGVAGMRAHGATDIVVKTGGRGCCVYSGTESHEIAGFHIEPVDSTGAGDCFAGAFLAGLHRRWAYLKCATFANAVGAMVVEQLGATRGVGDFEETLAWMRRHGG